MHSHNIHPSGITASRNSVKKWKVIVLASNEKSFMSFVKENISDDNNRENIEVKQGALSQVS